MDPKQNIVLSLVGVAMISIFLFIVFGDNGLAELRTMKKGRDSLVQKNDALVRTNITLYRTIERLSSDLDYIENVARQELGVIGKDEMILKLADSGQKGVEE